MKNNSPFIVPSSYNDENQRPQWENYLSDSSNLEEGIQSFWAKYKFYILSGILLIQIGIFFWARSQASHPSLSPNESGRNLHRQNRLPNAEAMFIESASYGFHREKPLLNLGLNYYKMGDYEEAHRLLENVISSNRFYWQAYEADGRILWDWGIRELNNPECDIKQTEILWTVAKKRFRYAAILAFIKIKDYRDGIELHKSYKEMGAFLESLPDWRENCLNPPQGDSNDSQSKQGNDGENGENDSNNSDPNQNSNDSENSKNQEDNRENTLEKNVGNDKNQENNNNSPPNQSEIDKKREEYSKQRASRKESLNWDESDLGNLEEARKRISQGAGFEDYVRHKEEINIVTSVKELEEAMKEASW